MLEVQGKIEWISTLEVDTNKPGSVPGVITPTFYGCLEEIVEALPSMENVSMDVGMFNLSSIH